MSNAPRWPWIASALAHVGLLALALELPRARPIAPVAPAPITVDFQPAPIVPGVPAAPSAPSPHPEVAAVVLPTTPPAPPPLPLGAQRNAQNVAAETPGEHGDGRSLAPGRLLAERAEGLNLSPTLINTFAADQEQRLRTARDRSSPQDRRATPHPGYDPWIASSDGVLLFRASPAEALPARGATLPDGPAIVAGASARLPERVGDTGPTASTHALGALPRPSAGIDATPRGHVARAQGPSAPGHASILAGHASTTSDFADERPRDDADAEALATNLMRNAIAATVHAGPEHAEGVGGVGGGGAPGSGGGLDAGGRARAFGDDDGWRSLSAPDARYARYFQRVRRQLDGLWADAFPHDEALRLRQGRVILHFVIERDGSVRDVSVHVRSDVPRFDANVRNAIAGARLPPIPAELRTAEIRVTAPFVFRNPIVR